MTTGGRAAREPLLAKDVAAMATAMRIPGRSKMTTEQKRAAIGRAGAERGQTTEGAGARERLQAAIGFGQGFSEINVSGQDNPGMKQNRRFRVALDFGRRERYADETPMPSENLKDAITNYTNALEKTTRMRFETYHREKSYFERLTKAYKSGRKGPGDLTEYLEFCNSDGVPPSATRSVTKYASLALKSINPDAIPDESLEGFCDAWFPVYAKIHSMLLGQVCVLNGGLAKMMPNYIKECVPLYHLLNELFGRSEICHAKMAYYSNLHHELLTYKYKERPTTMMKYVKKCNEKYANDDFLQYIIPEHLKVCAFEPVKELYDGYLKFGINLRDGLKHGNEKQEENRGNLKWYHEELVEYGGLLNVLAKRLGYESTVSEGIPPDASGFTGLEEGITTDFDVGFAPKSGGSKKAAGPPAAKSRASRLSGRRPTAATLKPERKRSGSLKSRLTT